MFREQSDDKPVSMSLAQRAIRFICVSLTLVSQLYGNDPRAPDFSVSFWALEARPFIIGETGVSDGENLTKGRVEGWLHRPDGLA